MSISGPSSRYAFVEDASDEDPDGTGVPRWRHGVRGAPAPMHVPHDASFGDSWAETMIPESAGLSGNRSSSYGPYERPYDSGNTRQWLGSDFQYGDDPWEHRSPSSRTRQISPPPPEGHTSLRPREVQVRDWERENKMLKQQLRDYSSRLRTLEDHVSAIEDRTMASHDSLLFAPQLTTRKRQRDRVDSGQSSPEELERQGISVSCFIERNSAKVTSASDIWPTAGSRLEDRAWEQQKSVLAATGSTCELFEIQAMEHFVDEAGIEKTTLICPGGPRPEEPESGLTRLRWL